ncbi:uncharacterized protein EV420DRAFT_1646011 [Desarmillaria tabescens]|uniref:Uncharacterized protein n=1 Tax=Armillaria tabescens TaxID=1929756 RepID=A0AA39K0D0_ARMTA|nr:uncharacterized protein EV420DRAFT_1646011 [Desarmillaria tabescens]KAK0452048.1 hypothetical protein EV420DRAFT_1646011 [Desarmillaria tabescens]
MKAILEEPPLGPMVAMLLSLVLQPYRIQKPVSFEAIDFTCTYNAVKNHRHGTTVSQESHTKRMEHLPYNPPVFPSQDLSSGVAVPPPKHRQTRKDHHSRAERYQLESHLLTAQIEALQSHITAYIANKPPGDLRYTPNPLAVVAARRCKERQEVKPSRVLVKEVRKLRMKREELLAAREQMKTEYEERQRSRQIGHPSLGPL